MSKTLISYFSISGVTKRAAALINEVVGGDLFEIVPETPYTKEDIDWTDKTSRSTLEMQDLNCRPAVASKVVGLADYDTIFIGFPVWWGREPSIVDTFIDENDLTGKKIVLFCTSGGGDIDGAVARVTELVAGKATVTCGKRISADASTEDIKAWICK